MLFRKIHILSMQIVIQNHHFGHWASLSGHLKCNIKINYPKVKRNLSLNAVKYSDQSNIENPPEVLTKPQAHALILRLNDEERSNLMTALHEYQSKIIKDEYEGQLAASRWRSKYGRPSKLPKLGDVDPTGTYCPVPEDWFKKKFAETVPRPSTKNLIDLSVANSIPFIGFGFLDNFFMLIFGDYIDIYLGSYFCLSTMAAAALGNTLSDILGIGTAFHVERLATRIGFAPPKLSPIQLEMKSSRKAANFGRVFGVTLGCILGMCPLLIRKLRGIDDDEKE